LSYALALTLPSPPSPVIFEVGPFALRWYGLFIALGIAAATWLTVRELNRRGYDGAMALDALFFIVPLGFIGARAYHVIIARLRGISALAFADAVAPGLVLAQAIGRFGNFFNQELFGRPSDLPWAIEIAPSNRPPQFNDAASFHPTFLYESIWDVLVCLILLFIARRFANSLKNGDIFLLYVCLYSVGRFFVETLRVDPAFLIGDFRGNLFVASVLALTFALILFLRHASTGRDRKRPADS
jgi:phosphatidylglycerol---prolipoprotein diacylglyceryl transferase